jgi:hypothetical protein
MTVAPKAEPKVALMVATLVEKRAHKKAAVMVEQTVAKMEFQ